MASPAFFAELKRRNVYKVAVAYVVVAWLLIQAASILFPTFEAPAWVMKVFVAAIAAGFPIALIFAWAFELTPEGIKRADEVPAEQSITRKTGHKLMRLTIALAVIAAGLLLFQFSRPRSPNGPAAAKATAPGPETGTAAAIPPKSIAVLPFDSLSEEKGNAYFAEGIQDEILTRLAKVADLKVISRTSTQRFKTAPADLRDIAKQLGVMNILEGSVQRSNDQVRVNVQLINAMSDAHLWAEIYDRKLTDIFAVESDIAKAIADMLQAKLTGSEVHAMSKQPTANPEAHELYLRGRYFWNKRTGGDLLRAVDEFKGAIAKDPQYALAYAGLADSYLLLPAFAGGSPEESLPQAKAAAAKALELDDTLAEAHTSLAMALFAFDLEFEASAAEFEKAIKLNPNYATAHHWYSNATLAALKQWDRMFVEADRAVELDPLSLIINTDRGANFVVARRYDDAIAALRKALRMDDRFAYAHVTLGQALQLKADLNGAIAEFGKAVQLDPDDTGVLAFFGAAQARAGRRAEAEKILARLTETAKSKYVSNLSFATLWLALGDKEKATEQLELSYHSRAGTDVNFIHIDPMLDDLRGYPRFEALVKKVLKTP
jgi:TolB-like protein/Tfp pilus assembly protein PilF